MRDPFVILVYVTCVSIISGAKLGEEAVSTPENGCSCVNLSFCDPSSTNQEVTCPNRAQVCCISASGVPEELPVDLPGIIENLPELPPLEENESNGSCICMPSTSCIDLRKGAFSVATRTQHCDESGHICCSLEVTDDEFLTGIFGTPELTAEPPIAVVDTPTVISDDVCRCVPSTECEEEQLPDLLGLVHLRSGARNTCEQDFVCCQDKNIIVPALPIGPEPSLPTSCTCVPSVDCVQEAPDISAIVHVRSSLRTSVCSDPNAVCCPTTHLGESVRAEDTDVIQGDPIPTASCICIGATRCLSGNVEGRTCLNTGDICCPEADVLNIRTVTVMDKPLCSCVHATACSLNDIGEGSCDGADEVCCLNPRLSCGQSHETNARIDLRVRGGFQAKFAEFPWMVAILYEMDDGTSNYTCGGSLIHPQVVMTTAHCIDKNLDIVMKIHAGDLDIQSTSERYPHQKRYVSQRLLHPEYSPRTLQYDIGLLVLNEPVTLEYHINTICLPSPGHASPKRACQVSGWGKDRFGDDGRLQTTLKKIHLPLLDHDYCQKALRKTRLGPGFNLGSTFACAGGVRDDACSGDGGSPLICPMADGSNRYIQMGAVAWGIECGNLDVPGVYASVNSAMPWIRDFMTKTFGEKASNYFT